MTAAHPATVDDDVEVFTDAPTRPLILAHVEQISDDEWHAIRAQGIGGSDAAAIAGMHSYKSPFALWLEKTGQHSDRSDSEQAYWGRKLEPYVAERFTEETGIALLDNKVVLAHPNRTWQRANVDRFAGPDAILECKTVNPWDSSWADPGGFDVDALPASAALQVLHCLDVGGWDLAYVAVLIGGQRFKRYVVERDDDMLAHLRSIEEAFWQLVLDETPPPPMAVDTDLLAHLYEVEKDSFVSLDEHAVEVARLLEERAAAKSAIATHESACAVAENRVKTLLGEHEVGTLAGVPAVTWKQITTNRLDQAALKADHPDLVDTYTRPSAYRRFYVPKPKKGK